MFIRGERTIILPLKFVVFVVISNEINKIIINELLCFKFIFLYIH